MSEPRKPPLVGETLWAWHVVTDPNEPLPVLPSGWTLAAPATGPECTCGVEVRNGAGIWKPDPNCPVHATPATGPLPGSDWTDPKG